MILEFQYPTQRVILLLPPDLVGGCSSDLLGEQWLFPSGEARVLRIKWKQLLYVRMIRGSEDLVTLWDTPDTDVWDDALRENPSGELLWEYEQVLARAGVAPAVCSLCHQPMIEGTSCIPCIEIGGVPCKRIPFDGDQRHRPGYPAVKCHDCSCLPGQYHHYCDVEICPICGDQLFTCPHRLPTEESETAMREEGGDPHLPLPSRPGEPIL